MHDIRPSPPELGHTADLCEGRVLSLQNILFLYGFYFVGSIVLYHRPYIGRVKKCVHP